jgi:hypothetical protein
VVEKLDISKGMIAYVNGFLGTGLVLILGTQVLQWTIIDSIWAVVAANVAGFLSVIAILRLETFPTMKATLLKGSYRTWIVFSLLILAIVLGVCPPLRNVKAFALLFIPMCMSNGFQMLVFGPIQDRFVRKSQRAAKARSFPDKVLVL